MPPSWITRSRFLPQHLINSNIKFPEFRGCLSSTTGQLCPCRPAFITHAGKTSVVTHSCQRVLCHARWRSYTIFDSDGTLATFPSNILELFVSQYSHRPIRLQYIPLSRSASENLPYSILQFCLINLCPTCRFVNMQVDTMDHRIQR